MKLVILGAGGYGRTIKDLAESTGRFDEILFLDDNAEDENKRCSAYALYKDESVLYPAFGDNKIRLGWIEKLQAEGYELLTMIHPSAYVSKTAKTGDGTIVMPHASIGTGYVIEHGCIINMNAVIDHDCLIGKGTHVCLGAIVKAGNRTEACTKIEAGEVIERNAFPAGGIQ